MRRSWSQWRRSRTVLCIVTLGAALLPGVASASPPQADVPAAPAAKPDDVLQDGQPDDDRRAVTAAALDEALRSGTADLFAGIEIGDGGTDILVHAIDDGSNRTSDTIDRVVGQLGDRGLARSAVTTDVAKVTLSSLEKRRDILTAHVEDLRARGTRLVTWAAAVISNTLEVGVEGLDSDAAAHIRDLVGADALTLRDAKPNANASRTTDSSPWYGGDLLSPTPLGGSCTSGFSVRDGSGVTYDLTAGHCGNGTFKQNGQGYGVTISMNFCNNCDGDEQTVSTYPGSAAGWVFTSASGAVKVGSYALGSYAGDTICTDGYFTGESCGVRVDVIDMCGNFSGTTTCGVDSMHSLSGSTVIQPGDSGGPVYDYRGDGRLNARGLLKGSNGCGSGPCSSGFFVPIHRVLANHSGISVLTVP